MLKTLLTATALTAGASIASAATVGFDATISNGAGNLGTITLVNNSSAENAQLSRFELTIGHTKYNFDWVDQISASADGTAALVFGDSTRSKVLPNLRSEKIALAFTGFDAGEQASFRVDIDTGKWNTDASYEDAFFDNGAADNAVATAFFSVNGQTQEVSFTFGDSEPVAQLTSESKDGYNFGASAEALTPIPLPAGMPLMLGGIAALGFLRARRKTS